MADRVNMKNVLTLWSWRPEMIPERLDLAAVAYAEKAAGGAADSDQWRAVAEACTAAAEDCRGKLAACSSVVSAGPHPPQTHQVRKYLTIWTWRPETIPDRFKRAGAFYSNLAGQDSGRAPQWRAVSAALSAAGEDCNRRLCLTRGSPTV